MGDSRGHWEGRTLVIDVTNHNDQTWFDQVGAFHSDGLRVTERWTFAAQDALDYQATIVDPEGVHAAVEDRHELRAKHGDRVRADGERRVGRQPFRGTHASKGPAMIRRLTLVIAILVGASGALHAQTTSVPVTPVEHDVTVLTYKIHYWEAGSGAPVLLLHGTGGEGARWMPNIKGLGSDFHVFAIDQIGFGGSDKPLANYHSGVMAEFAAGFLKAVGIERATIIGQSMGAGVALYMAVHYPQMVDHLGTG